MRSMQSVLLYSRVCSFSRAMPCLWEFVLLSSRNPGGKVTISRAMSVRAFDGGADNILREKSVIAATEAEVWAVGREIRAAGERSRRYMRGKIEAAQLLSVGARGAC